MDDSDESTAVFSIRKNFNDFMSGMSGSSFNSKLNFAAVDDRPLQQQVELVSTRSHLSRVQLQLSSAETERKRARIEHDRDMESVKKEQQYELEKVADLKRQLVRLACKEEIARQDLADAKKLMDTTVGELQEKLSTAQKEKLQLDSELQDLKQDMRSKLSELKMENTRLSQANQKGRSEFQEAKKLLQMARSENLQLSKVQNELIDAQAKLANSEQQVKALELTVSRAEEDIKVGKAMRSQLTRLGQLETENKKLTEENQYLRAVQENTLVLREECESLRKKLERADERSAKLTALEVEHEDAKKRLSEWQTVEISGLSGLRSPTHLSRSLAELQRNNELLLEKNGQLQASLHALESTSQTAKQQLQSLQADLTLERTKHQTAVDNIKRLNRRLLLVTKEKDGFKSIIESYESELTMTAASKSDNKIRQNLEEALENQRRHCVVLEAELQKTAEQSSQHRTRAMLLEQQLTQLRETHSSTAVTAAASAAASASAVDECNQNIAIELRHRVAELEKNVAALTDEKENLLAQLERFDIQGEYDRSKTKVIQFSMNPFSVANRKLTSDLNRLRDENAKLTERLRILEETQGRVDDLTTKVDLRLQASSGKEVEEIRAQLVSAELKNKRLVEFFKDLSHEMREVSYQLLGYRIDIATSKQYKLMNMYAESPSDYFLFKQTSDGEMQMLANDYSSSFTDKISTYLHGADSIPAFLSSVTLDLFNRQTFMAQQSRSFH